MAADLCRILEWDSEHFGVRIARVVADRLNEQQAREVVEWCNQHSVRGLYYLCPAMERESAAVAIRFGFNLVDIRVDMERCMDGISLPAANGGVRRAMPADVEKLKAIAAKSHHDTRFYADVHFPREACDRLYEIWIEKSCRNPNGAVWTADGQDGWPVGYVTCELEKARVGRIGLVAVRDTLRGQGWGRRLMNYALKWFAEAGCVRIRVATQGGNAAALNLYGRCGFITTQVGLWFHKWFWQTNEHIQNTI